MDTLKTIAEIVSAFGTLIVAGIVAYIAYRQHRTEKNKLKLDLYDRRLQVFEAGMKFIEHVVKQGDADTQALAAVNNARFEGMFLFPHDVADYLCRLYEKGVDVKFTNMELNGQTLPDGDERKEKVHQQAERFKWFIRQSKELQNRLRPYMGFEE